MSENQSLSALPPDPHADVTASEVASYAYCAKAWHLRYVLRRENALPSASVLHFKGHIR